MNNVEFSFRPERVDGCIASAYTVFSHPTTVSTVMVHLLGVQLADNLLARVSTYLYSRDITDRVL